MAPLDAYTLNFTEGQVFGIDGPGGLGAQVSHLFWRTDTGMSPLDHTPTACMVAAGYSMVGEPRAITLHAAGAAFPGECYRFEQEGLFTTVFQTITYGGEPASVGTAQSRLQRLTQLWNRPRRQGIEALTVYLAGDANERGDTSKIESILAQVLVPARR